MEFVLTIKTGSIEDLTRIAVLLKAAIQEGEIRAEFDGKLESGEVIQTIEDESPQPLDLSNTRDKAVCPCCFSEFTPKTSRSHYCSSRCREKHKTSLKVDELLKKLKLEALQQVKRPEHDRLF